MVKILLVILVLAALIDLKYRVVPDYLTIPSIVFGMCLNGVQGVFGAVVGILLVHSFNTLKITSSGGGDAKLMGVIGSFMGIVGALVVCCLSVALGRIYRMNKGNVSIPYAPFIGFATFLVVIYG